MIPAPSALPAAGDAIEVDVAWTTTDVLLYALGVGAGQVPTRELAFTTENSDGIAPRVLPTFGTLIAHPPAARIPLDGIDPARGLLEWQSLTLHCPLPLEGRARVIARVAGVYDRGWAAVVESDATADDAVTGQRLLTARRWLCLKGVGGFGGPTPPARDWPVPDRPPDLDVEVVTRPEQALIYRLCGDRNPLHSDPAYARRCGFRSPILHGLCTFGCVGRVLLHHLCDSDPARVRGISARFSRRVIPGDALHVAAWRQGAVCCFRAVDERQRAVLDHGVLTIADANAADVPPAGARSAGRLPLAQLPIIDG
jgi:acyl dehydratase